MNREYWKHLLIRTPFEPVAKRMRSLKKPRDPNLRPLWTEARCIEQMLPKLIGRRSNCIDIGCHIGSMLSTMCRLAPEGRHMGVEPLSHKAAWLRKKFPEVDIQQIALGCAPGEVSFYHDVSRSGYSGLAMRERRGATSVEQITVQCLRLDDVVPADRRIDFIKIDVEGAVLPLLQGAVSTLKRHQPAILMECTASGTKRFNTTPEQVFDLLTVELGYQIFVVSQWLINGPPINRASFATASEYPPVARDFLAIGR